jgi:DNA repair ATPase RecN
MADSSITIVSSVFEALGISTFMYFLIKGLNTKISSLEATVKIQKETMAAMEVRLEEVGKLGKTYANFAEELPKYVENYEKLVSATKDRAIKHLESEVSIYEKKLEKYESLLLNKKKRSSAE